MRGVEVGRAGGKASLVIAAALALTGCQRSESRSIASEVPVGLPTSRPLQLEPPSSRSEALERRIAALDGHSEPAAQHRLDILVAVRSELECRDLPAPAKVTCLTHARDGFRALLSKPGFTDAERNALQSEIDDITRRLGGIQ